MNNEKTEYEHLLESFAADFFGLVCEYAKKFKWKSALLDVRASASDLNDRMEKVRIVKNDDSIDGMCDLSFEMMDKYLKLWVLMPSIFDSPWYGFKLIVYASGEHKMEYNYDPKCIDDPSFIDF